jgi:hypothetical protein
MMLRRSAILLGVGVLGAFVLAVWAQSQESKAPSQSEMKKQFAKMDELPTEEHTRLAALVGDFDQNAEVLRGPGEPLRSHVLASGEWIMGGRFVRIAAKTAPDEELKGERLTVYGYDTRAGKYTMWTIDSSNSFAVSASGDYDAATKTFTLDGERYAQGTSKVPFRWTVRLQGGGAFTQEILMKLPQGQEYVPVVTVKNTPRGK